MCSTRHPRYPLLLLSFATLISSYQWPQPKLDALEEMLYTGADKTGAPISQLASGCASRLSIHGPPIGAEWLRLAYHDMATHNVTDGSGGLDASIYYEYDRPENIGDGNIQSLNDFANSANKYVSRADVIAMGAVWGVAACGGPPIAFRGGRVDALSAGRFGVPEPQQDLSTHTESFRLQGFTPTEMINLVACGHAFGGVRHVDFPDIVPESSGDTDDSAVAGFDSTIQAYDNNVITEYLSGTTKNPLVVVTNTTLQSDRRIFSSDGNTTMNSLQSADSFRQACSSLLGRMLDTVPSDVSLTDEITFLPFKVSQAQITVMTGQIVFQVQTRVQINNESPPDVLLLWCDRRGSVSACSDGKANFARALTDSSIPGNISPLADALGIRFSRFAFTVPLSSSSVQKFWFEVTHSNGTVTVEDNGGGGYLVDQDSLISLTPAPTFTSSDGLITWKIIAGILMQDGNKLTNVSARILNNAPQVFSSANTRPSIPSPVNMTLDLQIDKGMGTMGEYQMYSGSIKANASSTIDYTADINGTQYNVDFVSISSSFNQAPDTQFSTVGKRALPNLNNSTTIPVSKPSAAARTNILGLRSTILITIVVLLSIIC